MKPPKPGPRDPDEETPSRPTFAWSSEIDWAKLGQFEPLIKSLCAGKPIAPDDWEVREFLADFLLNPKRRPSTGGAPPEYSDWTFGLIDGETVIIRREWSDLCNAAEHVSRLRKEKGLTKVAAIERTCSEFRASRYVRDGDDYKMEERPLTRIEKRRLAGFVNGSAADRKRRAGMPTRTKPAG